MKKRTIYKKLSMLLVCLMAISLIGCGNNKADNNGANEPTASAEPTQSADVNTGDVVAGSETGTNNEDEQQVDMSLVGTPQASEANPINDKIKGFYSETIAYPLLETEIIDELNYEEQDMTKTRYYYNFVDLDGDNIDEIIVQLNGEYNTTKDGDTVLVVKQKNMDNKKNDDDGFDIIAQYQAFANPLIISDNKTKGHRDLIFMNPDGTYKKVVYGKDAYKKMSEAETLKNIDEVTGVAVLCNDVANDTENNTGLYFS